MQDAVTDFIINRITAALQTMSNSSEEEVAWSRVGRAALKFEAAFLSSSHKEKSGVRKADKGTALRVPV